MQETTNDIVDAVKSNDIQSIEKMLSEEAKQRMEDPQKSISEFLKTIDGEVIEGRYFNGGGGESSSGMGYVYKSAVWIIEVKTSQSTYWLWVTWIIADTITPEKVGMSGMFWTDTEYNFIDELYD